jgi:aryl-alcohol dehydrogenase-like predicted oxidoreductase
MRLRELGRSGIRVSAIGLGCNNFGFFQDAAQATAVVHAALDAGITFFDMASEHGAGKEEELVGAALGSRRKQVVLATKFGQQELLGLRADGSMQFSDDTLRQGASRRWIMQSVEESLRRLRTDYIDLYQPHLIDAAVPAEETLRALDDLVRQGKVLAIGQAATSATAAQVASLQSLAARHGLTPFASMQAHYNLLVRDAEQEILPMLRELHMSLLPYWPLANGLLSGKYAPGAPPPEGTRLRKIPMVNGIYAPEHWHKVEIIRSFANARELDMAELALSWLLSDATVASVIAGASTPEQVTRNARAAERTFAPEDLAELKHLLSADWPPPPASDR